jgi:hypothetical protein
MDGRAQLQSLAHAINGSSEVEAAWAGTGPWVDIRKSCGICGADQPVRVPFLRHVCRGCAAVWVPGICGLCAHTSVTFTMDGQLSPFATCGCSGQLRQLAVIPKPRATVDPEVAAARQVVVRKSHHRAKWMSRSLLVFIAVLATVGGLRLVRHNHAAPPADTGVDVRRNVQDDPALPMADRGRLAAARLRARGENHDVFACAAELPAPAPTTPSSLPRTTTVSPDNAAAGSSAFLAACLTG